MSFCYEVKRELSSLTVSRCCAKAELYGILLFANTFNHREIKLITENIAVVNRVLTHLKRLFTLNLEYLEREGKSASNYCLDIIRPEFLNRIFVGLGAEIGGISLRIDHKVLEDDCCRAAFIRGAFLSGGTITSPDKAYHLEFVTPRLGLSKDFFTFLSEFDLSPKKIIRKSNHIIYFKESIAIEDLLNIMGAKKSEFELMNTKILKEIRNGANRVTNCETANISKTIMAASEHKRAINALIKSGRFELLSDDLKEIAIKRIENEELSLSELGALFKPPISKSSLNNKIKKIMDFSKKI